MKKDEFSRYYAKNKRQRFKDKVLFKVQKVKDWTIRNRYTLATYVPVAISGLTIFTKVVGKRINLGKAERVKNLYCYDRSLGHYWRLKRKLSNREWLEIDKRKAKGERLADILAEMKVLK